MGSALRRSGQSWGGSGVGASPETAAEAYQRRFHIVKQTGPRALARLLACNEDIIDARKAQLWQKEADAFAEAAAGAVAGDGVADFAGGGEAHARGFAWFRAPAGLDHQHAAAIRLAVRHEQEFATRPQAFEGQRSCDVVRVFRRNRKFARA